MRTAGVMLYDFLRRHISCRFCENLIVPSMQASVVVHQTAAKKNGSRQRDD